MSQYLMISLQVADTQMNHLLVVLEVFGEADLVAVQAAAPEEESHFHLLQQP
jgi:hypothetical protein